MENQDSPIDETGKMPETVAPADHAPQGQNDTPSALSLASVVASHVDSHPGFDPSKHAVNADGTPKRKGDGSYASKRGRKPASASPLPPKGDFAAPPEVETTAQVSTPRISPDEAARQSANLVINGAVWICGEEIGKPIDKAEAEGLKISFKNYYESRGVPDIPPEVGLILGLASYIIPRFKRAEKESGKMTRLVLWIREKAGI